MTKNRVTVKLANLLLDKNDLDAAEPLIGNLIEAGDSPNALRARARYADLQGDATRAVELMESLQESFPDDWGEADNEPLERFRAAAR